MALSRAIARSWRTLGGLLACGLLLLPVQPAAGEPASGVRSGPKSFTIEASIQTTAPGSVSATRCSGRAARLVPGVTRCLVYRVDNHLDVPITVQSITMSLDPAFPAPPSGCSKDNLALPTFSGDLSVPGGGSAASPGLPIRLESTDTNQDDCQQTVLHFVFAGAAVAASGGTQQLPDTGAALSAGEMVRAVLVGCGLVSLGLVLLHVARRRDREGEWAR